MMVQQREVYTFMKERGEICRSDIIKHFSMSKPTATRFFNALKKMTCVEEVYVKETINNRTYLIEYLRIRK